jgi:hypothetical protein
MSEITKACETCDATGKAIDFDVPTCQWPDVDCIDCPDCKGTGRVPDVGATLRAQLDAARLMCERLDSALRTKEGESAELRAEVARLTEERDYYKSERERLLPLAIQARKDAPSPVVVLPHGAAGDIVALRAEVARLAGRERDAADLIRDAANDPSGLHSEQGWTRARAAWLAGCKS